MTFNKFWNRIWRTGQHTPSSECTTFDLGERRGWGLKQSEQHRIIWWVLSKYLNETIASQYYKLLIKLAYVKKKKYKLKRELILIFKKWTAHVDNNHESL